MINQNKLRASYTLLDLWASGNWQRAVEYYFKLNEFTTRQMADGRTLHEEWDRHISAHKTLPDVFGGKRLVNPFPEVKKVVEIDKWLQFVGKIDCVDSPIIYEFKSGKQSSEVYAGSRQTGCYAVLYTLSGIYVEKAEIYHYDQYTKKTDMSITWLTDKVLADTMNWIETLSGEIYNYFNENNLFKRFGPSLDAHRAKLAREVQS